MVVLMKTPDSKTFKLINSHEMKSLHFYVLRILDLDNGTNTKFMIKFKKKNLLSKN